VKLKENSREYNIQRIGVPLYFLVALLKSRFRRWNEGCLDKKGAA
jgi:hypothetical protein